jgi:hypothetical protein
MTFPLNGIVITIRKLKMSNNNSKLSWTDNFLSKFILLDFVVILWYSRELFILLIIYKNKMKDSDLPVKEMQGKLIS